MIQLDRSRYLVVGVALIEFEANSRADAAVVTRGRTLGLHFSDQPGIKIGVGYSDAQTIRVPADAADDVRVEVREESGGAVHVEVGSAKLKPEFLP